MRKESKTIRIALGDNLWTRAIIDGSIKANHFPVEFHSDATLSDRLHGVKQGKWDGCDGTLTDYLLEKEQSLGDSQSRAADFYAGRISPTNSAYATG